MPETAIQGQVPIADHASGRAAKGYTCNAELVGSLRQGEPAGHGRRVQGRALRRRRRARLRLLRHHPARPTSLIDVEAGVNVLDMSDPAQSGAHRQADHAGDALAARVAGREPEARRARRGARQPGVLPGAGRRLRHLGQDCRHPVLKSSTPVGVLGHESGMAPDGRTFYSASPSTQTLVAVDISNLSAPVPLWIGPYDSHGLSISDDGNRAYVAGVDSGLIILDVSEIQARRAEPAGARGRASAVGLDEHPAERDPGDHRRPPLPGRDRRVRHPEGGRRRADHRHRRRDQAAGGLEPAARGAPAGELRRDRRRPRARSCRFRATRATTATCPSASTRGSSPAA